MKLTIKEAERLGLLNFVSGLSTGQMRFASGLLVRWASEIGPKTGSISFFAGSPRAEWNLSRVGLVKRGPHWRWIVRDASPCSTLEFDEKGRVSASRSSKHSDKHPLPREDCAHCWRDRENILTRKNS